MLNSLCGVIGRSVPISVSISNVWTYKDVSRVIFGFVMDDDNDNVETVQNNNKQKFTVKKESKTGNQSGNNMKRKVGGSSGNNNCKLFTVSINQIVNESENKKNNSLFTLDNKLSSLSRQLQSVNNQSKHHKFNVEHTKY